MANSLQSLSRLFEQLTAEAEAIVKQKEILEQDIHTLGARKTFVQNEIKKLEADAEAVKVKLDALDVSHGEHLEDQRRQSLKASTELAKVRLQTDQERREAEERRQQQLAAETALETRLRQLQDSKEALQASLADERQQLASVAADLTAATADLTRVRQEIEQAEVQHRAAAAEHESEARRWQQEMTEHEQQLAAATARLDEAHQAAKEWESRLAELQQEVREHDRVRKILASREKSLQEKEADFERRQQLARRRNSLLSL